MGPLVSERACKDSELRTRTRGPWDRPCMQCLFPAAASHVDGFGIVTPLQGHCKDEERETWSVKASWKIAPDSSRNGGSKKTTKQYIHAQRHI